VLQRPARDPPRGSRLSPRPGQRLDKGPWRWPSLRARSPPPTGVLTSTGKTRLSFSLWHIGPPLPHCRKTWVLSRQLKYLRVAQAKDHSSEVLGGGRRGVGECYNPEYTEARAAWCMSTGASTRHHYATFPQNPVGASTHSSSPTGHPAICDAVGSRHSRPAAPDYRHLSHLAGRQLYVPFSCPVPW
jgi:hypothetical protein